MDGLAMKLTYARVILIPLFVIAFYCHPAAWEQWIALIIYSIAAITDYFDGYLARKCQESSALGAFLDPVADKLMVCVVMIVLLQSSPTMWLMICTAIIIGREIWISALREWMASTGKRDVVAVTKVGKWKTTFQMVALGFLIFKESIWGLPIELIGQILLIIATVLTLYSMYLYSMSALYSLRKED